MPEVPEDVTSSFLQGQVGGYVPLDHDDLLHVQDYVVLWFPFVERRFEEPEDRLVRPFLIHGRI